MSDTMVPIANDPPELADAGGVALPGLPRFDPIDPDGRKRSRPWALMIGLLVSTVLIAAIIGAVLVTSAGASVGGGCGGG